MHTRISSKIVGVDLLQSRGLYGVEHYSLELIKELTQLDNTIQILVFCNSILEGEIRKFFVGCPNIILKPNPLGGEIGAVIYQQCFLPFVCFFKDIRVIYSTSIFFSWLAPSVKINTVHDAAYARFKDYRNLLSKSYIKINLLLAKSLVKRIVTSSAFSKTEITRFYNYLPQNVEVIPGATASPVCAADQEPFDLRKFDIHNKKFFFYIGNAHIRKNLDSLLEAYQKIAEVDQSVYLVLAGSCCNDLRLANKIRKSSCGKRIILVGQVSSEEKTALYRNCIALIYPSLYEGFGLPILEAQAQDAVVITSNIGVMRETAGEGSLLVDPERVEEISNAMLSIIKDSELRTWLVKKGRENLNRYSWIKSAKLFSELLRGHG